MHKVPAHLKILQGNPGKRRIDPPIEPPMLASVPPPPAFLTDYAQEEWKRTAPGLFRLNMLTVLDLQTFAAYCQAYADWRMANEQLAAEVAENHSRLVRNRWGDLVPHPLLKVVAKAAADLVYYGGQFGLHPLGRSRIGSSVTGKPVSKFDGLVEP
jgi:P27 family predicted phage terminase small subunit